MPAYIQVLEQVIRSLDFIWKVREGSCEEAAFKLGPGGKKRCSKMRVKLASKAKEISRGKTLVSMA